MTQALARRSDDDNEIPWTATDPRRAPLRNDVVSALQTGLSPAVFWLTFFPAYYDGRTAVFAAIFVMFVITCAAFVVTWARMVSARRHRATVRTPRSKLTTALVVGLIIGFVTISTDSHAYPDKTLQFLVGLGAGLAAALILLVLEHFAVSVPATNRPAVSEWLRRATMPPKD